MPSRKLLAIDSNALIHRSFHALPALTSSRGEPVGALYGLCLTLLNVFKHFKPTHVVAAFDRQEETFRRKKHDFYKAQRKKAAPELIAQIIKAREVFAAFGVPVLEAAGYEADDIIGTVSRKAEKENLETIIVTGDQDELQLVGKTVRVHMLRRGIKDMVTMGPEEVIEKYGLKPEQMVDYKALRGDPSDNISGVPGVGEKTALELLRNYGSLEKLYANLEKVPEKWRKKLKEGEEKARTSQWLAQIDCSVPVDFELNGLIWNSYSREKVVALFREFGFSSLLARVPETDQGFQAGAKIRQQGSLLAIQEDPRAKRRTPGYELIRNETQAKKLTGALRKSGGFVVDTETDSLEARNANLCGISVAWEEGRAWYVPAEFVTLFKEVLEDETVPKWGHNLKYDQEAFQNFGIELKPAAFDTMIASYVIAPNSRAHSLDSLAFTLFGHEMIPIEALIGKKGAGQKNMSEVPLEDAAEYSCEDADYSLRLKNHFKKIFEGEPELNFVFEEIEMPLVQSLAHMEVAGVKLETEVLDELSKKIGRRLKKLEKEIHELAGMPFNINSPVQLREVLFNKLKLSTVGISRIQSGLSTAADELEKLSGAHPVIEKIQEHRELAKLKNTYLDTLPKLIDTRSGRLHTSYNQVVTATGRLSSSDPNLQNIPIRSEESGEIRKAFVAEKGNLLVAADYAQIELRLAAHVAKDKTMLKAFKDGRDIHAETAAFVLGVPIGEITKEQRRQAKVLNFGVLYGMGPQAFARASGVALGEAQKFIDQYMRSYRGIAEYMREAKAVALAQGHVKTIFGRRSYLPEINSGNPQIRAGAERAAINHPIQGAEGDIIKRAMNAVYKKIEEGKGVYENVKMILQVHDELVFEVPEKNAEKFARELKPFLEGLENISVPLIVDVKLGKNWGEMEKVKI